MSKANDDNFDPLFNGILHLEDQDFTKDGKLNLPGKYNGKPTVVMVFATWCGPCRSTKPHYSELFKELGGNNDDGDVIVACVNGSGETTLDSEQKLMKRIRDIIPDFRGFPHIAVFDDSGNYVQAHEGPRTKEALLGTVETYRRRDRLQQKAESGRDRRRNPSTRRKYQ